MSNISLQCNVPLGPCIRATALIHIKPSVQQFSLMAVVPPARQCALTYHKNCSGREIHEEPLDSQDPNQIEHLWDPLEHVLSMEALPTNIHRQTSRCQTPQDTCTSLMCWQVRAVKLHKGNMHNIRYVLLVLWLSSLWTSIVTYMLHFV